jgi:peptidylprolyl isomerase/FKBP-type peptidyl-prolyl cis-trans isomerase FklB
MKKYFFSLIIIATAIFGFSSCGDDENNSVEDWKAVNIQALINIRSNTGYNELKSPGNEASIYYKVLTKGAGSEPVYYTSTVGIYLKGWYVADYAGYNIKAGDVFQRWLFDDGIPYTTTVSTSVYLFKGLKVALQNMVKGDKWEIWIPYQLANGSSDYSNMPYYPPLGTGGGTTIPAFSTLVYEIEVVDIK